MLFLRGNTSDGKEFVVMDGEASLAMWLAENTSIGPAILLCIVAFIYALITGISADAAFLIIGIWIYLFGLLFIIYKLNRLKTSHLLFMIPLYFFTTLFCSLHETVFYDCTTRYDKKDITYSFNTLMTIDKKYLNYRISSYASEINLLCNKIFTFLCIAVIIAFILFFLTRVLNWQTMATLMFIFSVSAFILAIYFFSFPSVEEFLTRAPKFLGLKCIAFCIIGIIAGIYIIKKREKIYN